MASKYLLRKHLEQHGTLHDFMIHCLCLRLPGEAGQAKFIFYITHDGPACLVHGCNHEMIFQAVEQLCAFVNHNDCIRVE